MPDSANPQTCLTTVLASRYRLEPELGLGGMATVISPRTVGALVGLLGSWMDARVRRNS